MHVRNWVRGILAWSVKHSKIIQYVCMNPGLANALWLLIHIGYVSEWQLNSSITLYIDILNSKRLLFTERE